MQCAKPLLRRKLNNRAQAEPLYAQFIEERFGFYTNASAGGWLWVHAVSLGETRTAGILLKGLREKFPGTKLLLTHGTATGREEGQKLLQPGDVQVWQPWDSADAVARFFKAFQPTVGLILETEVWPNLVRGAQYANVPLLLVNARMSEKSLSKALRWPSLMKPAYAGLSAVLAQTQDDANRLQQLGAQVASITGNLKFDAKPDSAQVTLGQQWRAAFSKPVLMLASSREGEEQMLLEACQIYVQKNPNAHIQWLIVPRHPQRVNEVAQSIVQQGFAVSRRSSWGQTTDAQPPFDAPTPTILLGDSVGEMALYYSMSHAALLGGSFEPLGGQNLIEAAACACPVVMGQHTFNFAEASEAAVGCGAALRASKMLSAIESAVELAMSKQTHQEVANAALQFAAQHGGATERTVLAVGQWLDAT